MASRALAVLLAFCLVLASPGAGGRLAYADGGDSNGSYIDQKTGRPVLYGVKEAAPAPPTDAAIAALQSDPRVARQVPKEQREQAVKLLRLYGDSPEAAGALQTFTKDLKDPGKDANLSLASLFDRMSDFARRRDAGGTYTDVVSQSDKEQVLAIKSSIWGTTALQKSKEIGFNTHLRTVTRDDPDNPGAPIVDSIVVETQKGAATDQHVVYNRRIHEMLRGLKSQYYDQVDLSRQIREGEQGKDPKITPKALAKMRQVRAENQRIWSKQAPHLLEYLQKLDESRDAETLDKLDWKVAEQMQREAQRFSNGRQLEMMQKSVIAQLTSYFSQVTNCSPKEKKGEEALDATQKNIGDLQDTLSEFEKGHLEAFGPLMTKVFKYTKLSHEDQKYVTPELMNAASEAFAYVAAAQKAQHRAMDPGLSPDEVDAAVDESGKWLQLAQIQLMYFQTASLAIQLERLKAGELRDHLGLDDPKMKAQALKLSKVAREQYLDKIKKADQELKRTLLKQCIASFYMTYLNAAGAYIYTETLQERVKALAAKASEIKMLYLALRFDEYKRKFKGYSALAKVEGKVYAYFLAHLPEEEAANARALDALSNSLADMAKLQSAEAIRDGLAPMDDEFRDIVARLDPDSPDIPDLDEVNHEAANLSIKQSQLFGAVQTFTAQLQVFDQMNELDLYLRKYASSEMVASESDGFWSQLISFKWLDAASNVGGGRDASAEGLMKNNPLTKGFFKKFRLGFLGVPKPVQNMLVTGEAYKKLGDRRKRQAVLNLLADGRFNEALARIEKLDPKAAAKALRDYEAAKQPDDPFLDFESFMSKTTDDKALIKAQGVMGGLFDQLQPYIMGYTISSALYDVGAWTVATAGLGFLWETYLTTGKVVQAGVKGMEIARVAEEVEAIRKMGRMRRLIYGGIHAMSTLAGKVPVISSMVDYAGGVLMHWGNSFKQVLDVKEVETAWKIPKQMLSSLANSAHFTWDNIKGMSLASGGMTAAQHAWNPETSQYKDSWDAFWQGTVGGLAFGAKAGTMIMFSPVPASALGGGPMGKMMQEFAQSPGPLSSTISGAAKMFRPMSTVAKMGVIPAVETAFEGTAWKSIVGIGTWGWGMADGAAKYWLAAEVPRNIAEAGYFAYQRAAADGSSKSQNGATSYVHGLADANTFGMGLSQVSWLLVPVNQMYSYSDMREQREIFTSTNRLMRSGREGELLAAANGDKIAVDLTRLDQLADWSLPRAKKVDVTMNEQVRELVLRKDAAKKSTGELGAVVLADLEAYGGRQNMVDIEAVMAGGKPRPAENANDPRRVLEAVRHRARSAKPEAEAERLYAVFSKDGKLLEVAPGKAKPKGEVVLSITAKGDGAFYIDGKNAEKKFDKGGYQRAEQVLKDMSASLGKPEGLKRGEVFRTQESVAAYREALDERLLKDGATRKAIIDAARDGKTELVVDGVRFAGDYFTKLTEKAWRAQTNAPEYGLRATLKAVASVFGEKPELKIWNTVARGRLWKVLTGQPVETKAQMGVTEVVRDMEKRIASMARASDAQRLESMRTWALELEKTAADTPDAARLKPFLEALRAEGKPDDVIARAQAKLDDLVKDTLGAPAATLTAWDDKLQGLGQTADVPGVGDAIEKLKDLQAEKGRRPEDIERLKKVIAALTGKGREVAEGGPKPKATAGIWEALGEIEKMFSETAGAPADVLQLWKLRLERKSAEDLKQGIEETAQVVEFIRVQGGEKAKALERLSGILKGKGSPKDTAKAARAEIDALLDRTPGASAKDLTALADGLNRAADLSTREGVQSVLKEAKALKESAKGPALKALDRLVKTLGRENAPEQAVKGALDFAQGLKRSGRGASNEELDKLIKILNKKGSAKEVGAEALKYAETLRKKSSGADATLLERLKDVLGGKPPPQEIARAAREDIKGMLENTPGASRGTLESFRQGLAGEITADHLAVAARGALGEMIKDSSPETAAALEGLRRSIESDAVVQYANQNLVEKMKDYRARGVEGSAAAANYIAARSLLTDAWERGVFGQMFKKRMDSKTGERVWDVPDGFGIKDTRGIPVTSFREGQLKALNGVFDLIAGAQKGEGVKKQVYALLETSGGKTLLGFVLIGFMEAYARDEGKQGAYYVTANADLVNQTLDVYGTFFKGRKPSFKVITYSDLMVMQAQAQATGSLSPFETHEVYLDEFDTVGLGTPLSLGKFNGALSFPGIDPMHKALQAFVREAGLLRKGEKSWEGGETLYQKYLAGDPRGKSISREEFQQLLKDKPEFKKAYEELRRKAIDAVEAARKAVKSGKFVNELSKEDAEKLGMTRAQLYERLLREHENAFGTFFKLGVLEAKYGGVEGWVDKVLEGAIEAASEGEDLHKLYARDIKRPQIIQFHNDQALDSLDTHYRTALELSEGVPITLDFSHVAVTDFRKLVLAAKDADALAVAASGTLPDAMRDFFEKQEWGLVGEGSNPSKVLNLDTRVFSRSKGESQFAYAAKEIKALIAAGSSNVAFAWAQSDIKKDVLLEALHQEGIDIKGVVSEYTKPGSAYYVKERYMFELETAKNVEGIKAGRVKIVILVGQGGLRGLEVPLPEEFYAGASIPMYITDSHTLADVSLLQLLGRTDVGRVPKGAITSYHLLDEAETMLESKTYAQEMPEKIKEAASFGFIEDRATGKMVARPMDEVKLFEAAKLLREDTDMPRGRPMTQEAVFELLKKPTLHKAKDAYRDYMTIHRLREAVGDEALKRAAADPNGPAMKELLSRPEVLQILAAEMRRVFEEKALESGMGRRKPKPNGVSIPTGALPGGAQPQPVPAGN